MPLEKTTTSDGRYEVAAWALNPVSEDGNGVWKTRWLITDTYTGDSMKETRTLVADSREAAEEKRDRMRWDIVEALEGGYFDSAESGILGYLGKVLEGPFDSAEDMARTEEASKILVSLLLGTDLGRTPWRIWTDTMARKVRAMIRDAGAEKAVERRAKELLTAVLERSRTYVQSLSHSAPGAVSRVVSTLDGVTMVMMAVDRDALRHPRRAAYAWISLLTGFQYLRIVALRRCDLDFNTRTITSRLKASPLGSGFAPHYEVEDAPVMVNQWPESLDPVMVWAAAACEDPSPDAFLFPNDRTGFDATSYVSRWIRGLEMSVLGEDAVEEIANSKRSPLALQRKVYGTTMTRAGFTPSKVTSTVGFIRGIGAAAPGGTEGMTMAEVAQRDLPAPDREVWGSLIAKEIED